MDEMPLSKDCRKAEAVMSRYMDGFATDRDAQWLNGHFATCNACKEDFLVYDDMLSGFAELATAPAPEGFEACVAAKVAACGKVYDGRGAVAEKAYTLTWTIVSLVLGVGILTSVWSEHLLTLSAESGIMAEYVAALTPFAEVVRSVSVQALAAISGLFGSVRTFIFENSVALTVATGVIFIAYAVFIMDRDKDAGRSRVDVNAESDVVI